MFNRTNLLASAVAVFASAPVFAGSIAEPLYQAAPTVYNNAGAHNWAGAYVGVNLGYGGDKAKHPISITDGVDTASGSLDITSGGFVGGVQAGYNFQSGRMVYGFEADLQGSGLKGETSANLGFGADTISGAIGTKLKSYATLRARIGHTVTDTFLVYATAGVARGKTESYANFAGNIGGTAFSDGISATATKTGYTVGFGAEYAFQNNWSLKSEYMYTDLGTANLYSGTLGGLNANLDRKMNFHTVRVGLNYKF